VQKGVEMDPGGSSKKFYTKGVEMHKMTGVKSVKGPDAHLKRSEERVDGKDIRGLKGRSEK